VVPAAETQTSAPFALIVACPQRTYGSNVRGRDSIAAAGRSNPCSSLATGTQAHSSAAPGLARRALVKDIPRQALECSVFVAPTEPSLTYAEISEVVKRLGYPDGEINDAFRIAVNSAMSSWFMQFAAYHASLNSPNR
jgi:hypothetical protein